MIRFFVRSIATDCRRRTTSSRRSGVEVAAAPALEPRVYPYLPPWLPPDGVPRTRSGRLLRPRINRNSVSYLCPDPPPSLLPVLSRSIMEYRDEDFGRNSNSSGTGRSSAPSLINLYKIIKFFEKNNIIFKIISKKKKK